MTIKQRKKYIEMAIYSNVFAIFVKSIKCLTGLSFFCFVQTARRKISLNHKKNKLYALHVSQYYWSQSIGKSLTKLLITLKKSGLLGQAMR